MELIKPNVGIFFSMILNIAIYLGIIYAIFKFAKQFLGFRTLQLESQAQTMLLASIAKKLGVPENEIEEAIKLSNEK